MNTWKDWLFIAAIYLVLAALCVLLGWAIMYWSYHLMAEIKSVPWRFVLVFIWFLGLGVATAPIGVPLMSRGKR